MSLNVVMLKIILMNVVMPNVIMLNVFVLNVVVLNVMVPQMHIPLFLSVRCKKCLIGVTTMRSIYSTVVEHSPHRLKVVGLSPVAAI